MSTDVNQQKAATPEAISPSLPTFTLKKKSKKSSGKRKKSKPINKASFSISMPSPPININDENNNTNQQNKFVSPHYKLSMQSRSKSPRSKSPRSSSTKSRKNSRSGSKHIHRASDIIKSSPRARSAKKAPKSQHNKTKSASNNNKSPRRKRKSSRCSSSSRNSVQMFFPLNNDNEDESDEENLFDSLAPLPSSNNDQNEIPILKVSASNPLSKTPKQINHSRTSKKRKGSNTSQSTPFDDDGKIMFGDMALLKRLKTENKELRKSRNLLRKDHDILSKIESKLRHKLEIILAKFKQIAIEFGDDHIKSDKNHQIDYNIMQKQGDIEGILEAVFVKFGQITDQYVKRQKIWKEQNKKWKDLTKKWSEFEGEYIVNEREISINRNSGNKNVGDILSNSVGKQFEMEYMFGCLKKRFDQINVEKTQKFKEYSTMISKSQKTNKKQKEKLDGMEGELLMVRKKNEELNENQHRMTQYKQEHLSMTRKLNETEEKFKTFKDTTEKQLKEKDDELDVYRKQHEIMNDKIEKLMDELTELRQCKDKFESENKSLSEQLNDIKTKYDELQTFEAKYKIMSTKLKDKDDELSELKATNLILTTKANQLDELQQEYQIISDKLKQCQSDRDQLKEENVSLTKKTKALDALKIEYSATQKRSQDIKIELEGLQEEFRVIYKAKKKLEIENDKLKAEISELTNKNEKLSTENEEFDKIVNKEKRECGTQTELFWNLENAHLEALRKDNAYLMKELNFLIAERSRFKQAVGDNDFHRGDINSIICSPTCHQIITGGKHDNSIRIWEPKHNEKGSEITFIPKRKAFVDGTILSVTVSEDGILAAAGCSLKNTPNGYVVVWNLKQNGNVLCNLRSRTLLRFGKVHCVKFMKFDENDGDEKNKNNNKPSTPRRHKRASSNTTSARSNAFRARSSSVNRKRHKTRQSMNGSQGKDMNKRLSSFSSKSKSKNKIKDGDIMNYLLFGGDTTGSILCWNLSLENCQTPICVISGHTDIIYDLCIIDNKWLFSVSHDETLMYVNIKGFEKKLNNSDMNGHGSMDYVFNKKLYKDDSKYPLKSVTYNHSKNELIFGSRKCNMFSMNTEYDDDLKINDDDKNAKKYFKNKNYLNTKDLDHISNLRVKDNLMMVQRNGINYVKVFNLETNKLIKTYQIDDGNNDNNKFKIYDCGISWDKKYAILCVGIFTKENLSNLELNRSALKGFKIPKSSKNKQQH